MGLLDFLFGKNKTTSKPKGVKDSESSKPLNFSGDQKKLFGVYPKLKGIDFGKVKFGASGNSPAEFFASDIDGEWYYAQSQMIMLFKAFSKEKFEAELKLSYLIKMGLAFKKK